MTKARPLRPALSPKTAAAWRAWLAGHHAISSGVWLTIHKKNAASGLLRYEEAVEEALCYGWIDGQLQTLDATRFRIWFSPRKTNSVWAESNKRRVRQLIRQGRMMPPGLALVEAAKRNGQWRAASARERTDLLPPPLKRTLTSRKGALARFLALTPSRRKMFLYWISTAKQESTRERRVARLLEYLTSSNPVLPWEPANRNRN
jgi:uncharacterized protein YdeI (YjbR/CyaY-like superfamily)